MQKDELLLCKQQLSKLSVERDQTVFELNKMTRLVERLQIKLQEKESEIQLLQDQLVDQEAFHNRQIEQLKAHYEYLKESAISRYQMTLNSDSMIKELKETKVVEQRKSSFSQEETRCQSISDYQRLYLEKQELQQLVDKLSNSQELIEEIQYLHNQLQQLTQELEQSKKTITNLQVTLLGQQ